MDALLQDLRHGARMLLKRPALSAMAVFALGLGMGFTTIMYSIVYGGVIRGLPFPESDRLMYLERNNPSRGIEEMGVTIHDYVDWRAQQRSFEDLAAFYIGTVNVTAGETPDRFQGAFITASAFSLLGVQPVLGRAFREEEQDPRSDLVMLLAYHVWRDRFGSNPAVVGRAVRVNGQPATVVGVMPEGFRFPLLEDVWVPLRLDPVALRRGQGQTLSVFGRLSAGVPLDAAGAEFASIARRLETEYPETNQGVGVGMQPYTRQFIGDDVVRMVWTMLAAVFLVLLVACTNVANLLLARAALRTKEVAIRTALGASRLRVVMQMLAEALALSAAGALLALGIAEIGIRFFNRAIAVDQPPFWIDIRLDFPVLLFVLGITLAAALIAGVIPAIQASGTRVNDVLKDESRGSSSLRMGRLSRGLIVAEIAFAGGLLVVAGLFIKSVVQLRSFDFPFSRDEVFTARVGLFESDYPDAASRQRFFAELLRRLEEQPGVSAAALASNLPFSGSAQWRLELEGDAYAQIQDYPLTRGVMVTPGFFAAFGVNVLQGRELTLQDDAGGLPVAIVSESFVRRFLAARSGNDATVNGGAGSVAGLAANALGVRIRYGGPDTTEPWRTIIGVVPDLLHGGPENEVPETMYVPLAQQDARFVSIVARTRGDPMRLTPLVREEVLAIDRDLPIYFVDSMASVVVRETWFYRVFGTLFAIFGAAALFLASVGLYAVMAFAVSRRTQEVGIRMALGAQQRDVLRLILRQGMLQLGIGLTLGLAIAATMSGGMRELLFDVQPFDPMIFAAIAAVLTATGLAASFVPARRATRVDPVTALRYE